VHITENNIIYIYISNEKKWLEKKRENAGENTEKRFMHRERKRETERD